MYLLPTQSQWLSRLGQSNYSQSFRAKPVIQKPVARTFQWLCSHALARPPNIPEDSQWTLHWGSWPSNKKMPTNSMVSKSSLNYCIDLALMICAACLQAALSAASSYQVKCDCIATSNWSIGRCRYDTTSSCIPRSGSLEEDLAGQNIRVMDIFRLYFHFDSWPPGWIKKKVPLSVLSLNSSCC